MTDRTEPQVQNKESALKGTAFKVLTAISASHLINDMLQSLILAIYPLLQKEFTLSFTQIGVITLTYQITASLLQPLIGHYTDKHPKPYSLPVGMGFTLAGLLLLAAAQTYGVILIAAALVGTGSSVFHPESSRVARMASGGRHGLAQSLFQVGGNFGSALGPLLAAIIIAPYGKGNVAWFAMVALLGMILLLQVSRWYSHQQQLAKKRGPAPVAVSHLPKRTVVFSLGILLMLVFSKYFYLTSLSSYYTFYLIHKFGVSIQNAQFHLFAFLLAVAAGTILGGPIGDKIGRKYVIWVSILGVAPFTLLLPHANLFWTSTLSIIIGVILASAFSAILVYAQELIPGKVGMVSGLFLDWPLGWVAWARRCSDMSRIKPVSSWFTKFVLSCLF